MVIIGPQQKNTKHNSIHKTVVKIFDFQRVSLL